MNIGDQVKITEAYPREGLHGAVGTVVKVSESDPSIVTAALDNGRLLVLLYEGSYEHAPISSRLPYVQKIGIKMALIDLRVDINDLVMIARDNNVQAKRIKTKANGSINYIMKRLFPDSTYSEDDLDPDYWGQ